MLYRVLGFRGIIYYSATVYVRGVRYGTARPRAVNNIIYYIT